jgi:WD40-like Beta Propeller Repeat
MSGRRGDHLTAVPDPRDEVVLDWLQAPEAGSSRAVLDSAFAELSSVRRRRPWPWDSLADSLRPEPFGTERRLALLLLVIALLLVAMVATLVATGAIRIRPSLLSVAPSESAPHASPAATGPAPTFPLARQGLQIVYQDGPLFVIGADGLGRRSVADDVDGPLVWPEWVPGTDTILALQGTFEGVEQTWAIDTSGARPSQVIIPCVSPCQSRNEAAVSHDGSTVVFFQAWGEAVDGVPPDCSLQLYDIATQLITPVTGHACGPSEERHPRFSPDDSEVAFWRSGPLLPVASGDAGPAVGESAIFVRDLSSGVERQVTAWSSRATNLDWSPDGEWLAFVPIVWKAGVENRDVWRVRADGTNLQRLTNFGPTTARLFRPLYSPDGRWILFHQYEGDQGRLRAVPSEGGPVIDVLAGINVLEYDVRLKP